MIGQATGEAGEETDSAQLFCSIDRLIDGVPGAPIGLEPAVEPLALARRRVGEAVEQRVAGRRDVGAPHLRRGAAGIVPAAVGVDDDLRHPVVLQP